MSEQSSPLGKDFILFAHKAHALLEEGNINQAFNLCSAGLRRFPSYATGHYVMGLCLEAKNDKEAKTEFERVLMYSPSHSKAMRKLSRIYEELNLKQLSDEFLVKEHLYNPLDEELVIILKERNLYSQQNPVEITTDEQIADLQEEIEDELEEDISEVDAEEKSVAPENEFDDTVDFDDEQELKEVEEFDTGEDELDLFDPLSGSVILEEDDFKAEENEKDETLHKQDLSQYDNTRDDFSTIMDGFFEVPKPGKTDEQEIENDEWIEVENLSIDEDVDFSDDKESRRPTELKEIDPISEVKDETELLLEQLSSSEVLSDNSNDITDNDLEYEIKPEQPEERDEDDFKEITPEEIENTAKPVETDEQVYIPDIPAYKPIEEKFETKFDHEEDVSIREMMENPILVTPTFGEILIAQRKFSEARHVFLELSKKEPENMRFIKKIEYLDKFLEAQNPA